MLVAPPPHPCFRLACAGAGLLALVPRCIFVASDVCSVRWRSTYSIRSGTPVLQSFTARSHVLPSSPQAD
eukprot:15468905-Alexandrium_andersonii.AAC.1